MFFKSLAIFAILICSISADDNAINTSPVKLLKLSTPDNPDTLLGTPVFAVLEDQKTSSRYEKRVGFKKITMSLDDFNIEEIEPRTFSKLGTFLTITLKNNKMKVIKKGVFNNIQEIVGLDFSNNEIAEIEEDAFDNMGHLVTINFNSNKIAKWNSNWFENSPKIAFFFFKDNLIEELQAYALFNLRGIKVVGGKKFGINLFLDNNKIKLINSTALKGVRTFDNLSLKNNKLKEFQEDIIDGISIKKIDLSLNAINCLPEKIQIFSVDPYDPPAC